MNFAEMLLKRVDLEGLLIDDLFGEVLMKKLQALAADTATPIDDQVVAYLYPRLMDLAREEVRKLKAMILAA